MLVALFLVVLFMVIAAAFFCRKRIEKLKHGRLLGNSDSRLQNDDSKLSYGPMHNQLQQRPGGIGHRSTDPYLELAVSSKQTGRFAPPQYR